MVAQPIKVTSIIWFMSSWCSMVYQLFHLQNLILVNLFHTAKHDREGERERGGGGGGGGACREERDSQTGTERDRDRNGSTDGDRSEHREKRAKQTGREGGRG